MIISVKFIRENEDSYFFEYYNDYQRYVKNFWIYKSKVFSDVLFKKVITKIDVDEYFFNNKIKE